MTATNRFYSCFLRTVCVISAVLFIVAICIIPSIPSFADETADVSESNSAISVEITLDKESYAKGEDVVIMLAVTNNTGKKLENVCARYYVPDCFEISEDVVSDLGTLNSRQTVRTQIHATAKTAFGSEIVKDAPDRDGTYVYVILLVACVIVFLTSTSLLVIRERNRKKIAATISFVFAFIFCFSAFSSALLPISADTSDVVLESSVTYEDAKSIINTILPDKYSGIVAQLSPSSPLTRERAAVISSIMILGKNSLPETSILRYNDVPADLFAAPYITLSVNAGIMSAPSASRFDPSAEVSGYEFLQYSLRALGFGASQEYVGQNGKANVIADALNLPFSDVEALLTEKTLTCSEALCHAMRMMMNSCVKKNESGEYVFTKSSLLSEFDGIIEKRAISDGADALITEDGKKIQIVEKALENKAYSVFFSGNSPIAIAESFYVLGHSLVPIYSGTELLELGACVEYTVPVPAKEYTACIGHFDTETFVFTANNVHYPVNENAFDKAVYMLDAKISDKSVIDYAKPVIFVSSFGSTAINPTLENIFCVYQLSSNVLADYSAFNVALDAAKAINNDGGVYLQSAYESFLASVDAIDFSLAKDLTDTEGSRLLISEATGALNAAMAELENYRIESYDELDAEMLRAQEYIPRAGEYTAESFTKLQEALENAQLLSRELLVSDESKAIIASHKGAISAAIAGLKYSTECDYGPYDATLKIALDITNTNGKYSDSDFADFQKTVNDIDKKLERNLPRTDANQRKVDDARKAILDAIEKLNSKLPCNYDALEKAIHEAENLIKDDPTNSTHRWVSYVFTAFADALGKAKAIDRNMTLGYGNTNQMEIDSAATGLFNATETLKISENKECDKSEFNAELEKAQAIKNDDGTYTAEAYALFTETLVKIKDRLDAHGKLYDCDESKEIIKTATDDIVKATEMLAAPEKCDYNKLNEKLTELDTLDRSLYTQKSLDALDAAIAEAKAIDPELLKDLYGDNQALIDGAIKKIDDAKAALLVMETFASQVVSDVYTSEVASGDSSTETVTLIKLLFEGKEKEFIVPEGITNIPKAGDIVIITVGGNEIISIEITAVELSEFTDGTTLSDITKHIAYEPVTPSVGDKAVFFKNSAGEVIFITKTTERIAETVYSASDSRLLIAGKEVSVAEGANFSAFTEKTLAKIIFAGRLAISAEPLTAIDATVSPSGENALYKENGGSEYKTLAASDTSFEAEEGSAHLTLTRLIEALKADGAAKTYNAKLFLDADGKLIACRLLDAVDESTGDAENPDSTGNTGGENPTT